MVEFPVGARLRRCPCLALLTGSLQRRPDGLVYATTQRVEVRGVALLGLNLRVERGGVDHRIDGTPKDALHLVRGQGFQLVYVFAEFFDESPAARRAGLGG